MQSVLETMKYMDAENNEIEAYLNHEALKFPETYSGFTSHRADEPAEVLIFPFLIPYTYVLSSNSITHYRLYQKRGGLLSKLYNSIVESLPTMASEKSNSHWIVDALVCPPNNALRDTHNYYPSMKPLIDAMTRSGKFFPDDNFNFVSCYMGYGTKLVMGEDISKLRFNTNATHYFKQNAKAKIPQALGFIVRIARYDYS